MTRHVKRLDVGRLKKRSRRLKGIAFLATGALIAGPAIAGALPAGYPAHIAKLRLIEAARAIGEQQINETTWEGDHQWRIAADGVREIRMTWPRGPVVTPFNLLAHDGVLTPAELEHAPPGIDGSAIEGAGANRIIVPGDHGSTTLRVHNDGPTAGRLIVTLEDNRLHNLRDADGNIIRTDQIGQPGTPDPAYDHIFINGVPVATLLAQDIRLGFTEVHDVDGVPTQARVVEIPIDAGGYVDLPFDWEFFANIRETDTYYRQPHNIGNDAQLLRAQGIDPRRPEAYTQADFRVNLTISGEVTQLTVLKAVEGPALPEAFGVGPDGFATLGDGWDIGVFSVGHMHDDEAHQPSAEFSGLYQTAAMRGALPQAERRWAQHGYINYSATTGLLVDPGSLYTVLLLDSPSPEFLLNQTAKNFTEIDQSFDSGMLAHSQIIPAERDVFGNYIGSLQCVLLGPFLDREGNRAVVADSAIVTPGEAAPMTHAQWRNSQYGGRNGLVQVPTDHHAVCEKVSQTSLLNVQKIVETYNAAGVQIAGGAAPTEWEINITPVYLVDDTWDAAQRAAANPAAQVAFPAISTGTMPDGSLTANILYLGFAENALVSRPAAIGANTALSSDMRILPVQSYRVDMIAPPGRIVEGYELVDVFLNVRQDQRAVGTGSPRRGQVAGFVPFGYTLADSPTRIEPPDGVTASWLLNFDELTASTITFRSSNRVSVTTPPTYIHHPGREIPGRVILAQTGADLALIVLAAAVLAAGAFLIVAARRRRSDSAKAEG